MFFKAKQTFCKRYAHWSKTLFVQSDSVPGFSYHFLAIILGIFQEQKMDITLGHDCWFVNCKTKIYYKGKPKRWLNDHFVVWLINT